MLSAAFRQPRALQRSLICLVSVLLASQPVFAWSGEGIRPRAEEPVSSNSLLPTAAEPEGSGQPLQIDILDGEGALNNIRARTAREPIVQVTDKNHKPVAGALVIFAIQPGTKSGSGLLHRAASASFHGPRTLRLRTDQNGRATARGLTPNGQVGSFVIEVTAVAGPLTATAIIHQQNVVGPKPTNSTAHSFLGPHTGLFTWTALGTVVAATTVITIIVVNGNSSTNISTGAGTVGKP